MKRKTTTATFGFTLGLMCAATAGAQQVGPNRTMLPIPEPQYPRSTILDARKATSSPKLEVRAPAGAPNVLVILIDDMGFGQPSSFGGPINMPTSERLANQGLRYNRFHTTALSSPTRMALLTGRNHHTCNMGAVTEMATSFPGNTGKRPESVATLATMLRYNGYSTAAFGKIHEVPAWEISPSGPTDRWPTRSGFDKFYGFMAAEMNQWNPLIYDGMTRVDPPNDPNYHFMTDMTNQAINWMKSVKSLTPDKPFFIYFAPGAMHAPHHVSKEWITKYKGKFDQGWDKLREETLARQKQLGVVPENTELAPKPPGVPDWNTLSRDQRRLFARQMEVYAAYGEYVDTEIGRLIQALEDLGRMDNTLVFYILGDNGASAEGGPEGAFNEGGVMNHREEELADVMKHIDDLGGPYSYNHYARGWAIAGNTPFTWAKQVASNYGGTRNGMIIHWPKAIKAKGELRSQWHHVIDIAPTILEAASLPEPTTVDGVTQTPIEGISMLYSLNDAKAKDRRVTQYFEMMGTRAVYHNGWFAGTIHKAPWEFNARNLLENDKWELYDTRVDFSLAKDLAAKEPEKLKEMQALFMAEAVKYPVLPIDDRLVDRFNPAIAGRPDLMAGRTSLTVYQGMKGMMENTFINTKNTSHSITAEVDIPVVGGGKGVILAQGGRFGGWSLYLKNGKPTYTYNWLGLERYTIAAKNALPAGKFIIRYEFAYDGGGFGKGGMSTIFVDGKEVGQGRIKNTQGYMISIDEGADVGEDGETPVVEDYGNAAPHKFNGKITKVIIDLKKMEKAGPVEKEKMRQTTLTRTLAE